MMNFPRQANVNPFLSAVNTPFAGVNPFTLGQQMGGFAQNPFAYLPVTQFGQYNPLAAQVGAGVVPGLNPLGINPGFNQMTAQFGQVNPLLSQIGAGINPLTAQFGQVNPLQSQVGAGINPLTAQFGGGFGPGINPFIAQTATNWPGATHFGQPGVGGRAYGIDPRIGASVGQPFGYTDPNVLLGLINPALGVDPSISRQVNPMLQQQLPIRPLINSPQLGGFQQNVPGFALPAQWPAAQVDPYRAFIEAQLISQLATNPLYQLQHQLQPIQQGYGGAETAGWNTQFGGQQFNPIYGNVPFCG